MKRIVITLFLALAILAQFGGEWAQAAGTIPTVPTVPTVPAAPHRGLIPSVPASQSGSIMPGESIGVLTGEIERMTGELVDGKQPNPWW